MARTYYDMLEVAPSASPETIRAAYVSLIKRYHPDTAGAEALERSKEITSAYDVLKDPQLRAAYDAQLRRNAERDAAQAAGESNAGFAPEAESAAPRPSAAAMVNLQMRQFSGIGVGTIVGHIFSVPAFAIVFYPSRAILGLIADNHSYAFSFLISLIAGALIGYASWAVGLIAGERFFYGSEYTFQTREAVLLRGMVLRIALNPDILLGTFVFVCAVRMVFFEGEYNTISAQVGCAVGACVAHRNLLMR